MCVMHLNKYAFLCHMIRIVILFGLLSTGVLNAQVHTPVFPNLIGDELKAKVIEAYKPEVVLTYSNARDTMFRLIDSVDDSLRCVYSGHTVYLDPNEDPTQAAFMGGSSEGINTEHTYPQSLGAEMGNARSDMHHLFPTRINVNSARGNKPFEEIDDITTNDWYYLNFSQQTIPSSDIIDFFSESDADGFEPPEDHKGDVARAMMYFYTMYQDFADAADSDYFNAQKDVLCQWHYQDEVDEKEYNRSIQIAKYQEGKANPFVLDCSLAERMFCEQGFCETASVDDVNFSQLKVYPNPAHTILNIELDDVFKNSKINIVNMLGVTIKFQDISVGKSLVQIDLDGVEAGIYFVVISGDDGLVDSQVFVVNR